MDNNPEKYIRILKIAWREEMVSQLIYGDLARREMNLERRKALMKLAASEKIHSSRWERQLTNLGVQMPPFRETDT